MRRQTLRKLLLLRRRWLPSIPQSLTVLAFWLLMAETADPANLLMGLLLAVVMPMIAARLEREFARMARLDVFLMLAGLLLWDLVKANFTVARQVLGPERKLTPHFIWIPLELTNNAALHAGIAVGTSTTYIGLFDSRGRTIRDASLSLAFWVFLLSTMMPSIAELWYRGELTLA